MIVKQQSLIGITFSFAIDNRSAIRIHDLGQEAARAKHIRDQASTLFQTNALSTNTWLCNQLGKLRNTLIEIFFKVGVDLLKIRHGVLLTFIFSMKLCTSRLT